MGFTQLYETFSALEDPNFWQDAYMKFYNAWFEADRWKQYFQGLGTTIQVTVMALLIGVVLGVLVAMIRTAHDQQRPGKRNPLLGLVNLLCKVYVTVIRGTPMMVQLLIMGLVIFASSRNKTLPDRRPVPGHQLGGLCGRDHPGRPHVPGPRPDGGGAFSGPGLSGHHALHRSAAGLQGDPPLPGQ